MRSILKEQNSTTSNSSPHSLIYLQDINSYNFSFIIHLTHLCGIATEFQQKKTLTYNNKTKKKYNIMLKLEQKRHKNKKRNITRRS